MADESMNRADRYIPLPGRGRRGVMVRSRLYLGSDHVLSVESNGFTENYKRFYFADIQGIVTRRTARWIWLAAVLFFLAAAVFSIVLLIPGIEAHRFALIGALSLLPFTAILLRGPTCICHLVTAVQREQLSSLTNLRVARKAVARISAAVESVQGTMTAEMRETLLVIQEDEVPESWKPFGSGGDADSRRRDNGIVHAVAFSLLIVTGLIWSRYFVSSKVYHFTWANEIALGSSPATLFLFIVALVRQRGSDISRAVRGVAWFSLLFLGVCLSFSSLIAVFSLSGFPYYFVYAVVSVAGCLILGIVGILAVLRHRRARKLHLNNPVVPTEEPLS
jgi:hypothetical protein